MNKDIVLECKDLCHWFGTNKVLHNVNLKIYRGSILSIVGPSGCGKSTLLRAIVGTHPPRKGEVRVSTGGGVLRKIVEPGRDRGIVYQRYSLFPFLTARENVAIGPMLDQTSIPFRIFQFPTWWKMKKKNLEEAQNLLEKVGLGNSGDLYPTEMSGGMQQRVAIAQALIMKPEILLLDEPFGALDESTRESLQRILLNLYKENTNAKNKGEKPPYTILIVTHELNEAIFVRDRVIGLSQFWNWKKSGIDVKPGATIVYDDNAPIFSPETEREFSQFNEQKENIRISAMTAENLQAPELFIKFK